jgi:hypothetical protein
MTNRMSIRQKVGEGWRRFLAVIPSFASVLVIFVCTACEAPKVHRDVRLWTDDLAFRISITPTPPVAEEVTVFKIFVQDKETGQPIETGEGRLFGTHKDKVNSYDGLAKGPEVGTYYARIRFPISGDWALGLQFRRDSTQPLQRTNDWVQTVLPAKPLGSDTTTR